VNKLSSAPNMSPALKEFFANADLAGKPIREIGEVMFGNDWRDCLTKALGLASTRSSHLD